MCARPPDFGDVEGTQERIAAYAGKLAGLKASLAEHSRCVRVWVHRTAQRADVHV